MTGAQVNPHTANTFRIEFLICLALAIIIGGLYSPVGSFDFVRYDDSRYITQNRMVRSGLTAESIRWAFTIDEKFYWQPLTWLSHMLDCQLFGLDPGWHHLTNLFLHLLNSIFLFLTLRLMTGAVWCSAFVALIFGIHPINVESVAWVSERKNVLSTFFWIWTMACYTIYCHKPTRLRYGITLGVFGAGLMAKPMLVTLPCVLLLLDFWPFNRIALPPNWRLSPPHDEISFSRGADGQPNAVSQIVIEKIPFFALSALVLFFSSITVKQLGVGVSFQSVPLTSRVANALVSYIVYLRQMIWPVDLAFFYPFPEAIPLWKPLTAGFLLSGSILLAVKYARQAPFCLVGWFWYLGTFVPAIGIAQVGLWPATADRFAYIPCIGLLIALAWGFRSAVYSRQWLTPFKIGLAVAAVAVVLSAISYDQIRTWTDSTALFQNAIQKTKGNFLAHNNLGNVYLAKGDTSRALEHYRQALKTNPGYAEAHNNMGAALFRQNRIDSAIEYFQAASELNPSDPVYRTNYHNVLSVKLYRAGKALKEEGRHDAALDSFDKALELNSGLSDAILMKGEIYEEIGDHHRAITQYKIFFNRYPTNPSIPVRIARQYALAGEIDQTMFWMKKAIANGFDGWEAIRNQPWFMDLAVVQPIRELLSAHGVIHPEKKQETPTNLP